MNQRLLLHLNDQSRFELAPVSRPTVFNVESGANDALKKQTFINQLRKTTVGIYSEYNIGIKEYQLLAFEQCLLSTKTS